MTCSPNKCFLSPFQYVVFWLASGKEPSGRTQGSAALVCHHRLCSKDSRHHDERADPEKLDGPAKTRYLNGLAESGRCIPVAICPDSRARVPYNPRSIAPGSRIPENVPNTRASWSKSNLERRTFCVNAASHNS